MTPHSLRQKPWVLVLLFVLAAIVGGCCDAVGLAMWNATAVWTCLLWLNLFYGVSDGLSILTIAWLGLRSGNVGKATWLTPILLYAFCDYCFSRILRIMDVFARAYWFRITNCLIWLCLFWLLLRTFGFSITPQGTHGQAKKLSIGILLTIIALVAVVLAVDAQTDAAFYVRSDSNSQSSIQMADVLVKLTTFLEPMFSGLSLFGTALLFVKGKRFKALGFLILILFGTTSLALVYLFKSVSLFPGVNPMETLWEDIGYAAVIELTRVTVIALGFYLISIVGYSIVFGHARVDLSSDL